MRRLLKLSLIILALTLPAAAQDMRKQATLYKSPDCTCCEGHARYLKRNGISTTVIEVADLSAFKKEHGVPTHLEGCHTILFEGYVIEGHVPINTIKKLLRERPAIKGISLPGMPLGAPGMDGPKEAPFVMYEIQEGEKRIFSTE